MMSKANTLADAVQHHQAGRLQAAGEIYKRILDAEPGHPDALYLFGVLAHDLGNNEISVECIRRAISLKGNSAEASYNLGGALADLNRHQEAVDCYRQAVIYDPNFAEAFFNMGNELRQLGELHLATGCYCRLLELKPDFVDGHINLGLSLSAQGENERAIAAYLRALTLKPQDAGIHSMVLMALQYCPGVSLAALADAHAQFDRSHGAPAGIEFVPPRVRTDRPERLRLGLVSADLGRHPVGYFTIGAFQHLDRNLFETTVYSDRRETDELTQRFRSLTTHWRDVKDLSDKCLVDQVRADGIDILLDLAGHTANNRLVAFAHRAAPVQITWAGYTGTTGLTVMDYLLADSLHVPPGSETHYRERVLRMPHAYVSYEPPDYAPPVSPLPAVENRCVTFGCFNNPNKLNPLTISVWSQLLRRLPTSRLVFKYRGWNDQHFAQHIADQFVAQGILRERLEFQSQSAHAELLAEYGRIDLALDTFPYSGGLTTCEALWMGVPVVTCPGEIFASRHSFCHLTNVGLTETIAENLDDYVDRAVTLANNLSHLAELRSSLRDRMAASPLCDGQQFAGNFARLLRDAWNRIPVAA